VNFRRYCPAMIPIHRVVHENDNIESVIPRAQTRCVPGPLVPTRMRAGLAYTSFRPCTPFHPSPPTAWLAGSPRPRFPSFSGNHPASVVKHQAGYRCGVGAGPSVHLGRIDDAVIHISSDSSFNALKPMRPSALHLSRDDRAFVCRRCSRSNGSGSRSPAHDADRGSVTAPLTTTIFRAHGRCPD